MAQINEETASRWAQIQDIWNEYVVEYRLLALVSLMLLGFWVFGDNLLNLLPDRLGYVTNVFTELLSIVVTVLVLDRFTQQRIDKQELVRLKALLGSNEAVVTKIAVAELTAKGWVDNGSLNWADLRNANLERARLENASLKYSSMQRCALNEADLRDANLEGARLSRANLESAKLNNANLKGAELIRTNLQEANLTDTHIQEANLIGANLKEAELMGTNLQGANLTGASLKGASLALNYRLGINMATFDETTILPDGTQWSEDIEMAMFTDIEHPKFDETDEKRFRILVEKARQIPYYLLELDKI